MKKDPILVTGTSDGIISLWNTKKNAWSESTIYKSESDYTLNKLSITPDQNLLAAACSDGLRLFDIPNEKNPFILKKYIEEKSNVISVGFEKNSQWGYYSTEIGSLNIIDLRDGQITEIYKQNQDINCALLNPNQGEIIFGDADGNVKVFDLQSNQIIANLCISKGIGVRSVAFSSDASLLAVANSEGVLRTLSISNTQNLTEMNKMKIHDDYILNVKISKDKNYLVTSSADKTIKVFNIIDSKIQEKYVLYGHTKWVWDITIFQNSNYLLSVSTDGSLKLWNLSTGKAVKEFFNQEQEHQESKKSLRRGYVALAFQEDILNQKLQCNINQNMVGLFGILREEKILNQKLL